MSSMLQHALAPNSWFGSGGRGGRTNLYWGGGGGGV